MGFKDEITTAFIMVMATSFAMTYRNNGPLWMGLIIGLGVFCFILGIDMLLKLISPTYRRIRNNTSGAG